MQNKWKRRATSPNAAAAAPAAHSIITLCNSLLSNLTLCIQNVNSLNISTNCPKQLKKINAISALNSDIIFLSDTRLNTTTHGDCSDLERSFLYCSTNQYKFYYNSKGNSRGVGILISNKLNITVSDRYEDKEDNILGLLCDYMGSKILLVSIYGPNTNTNAHVFFNNIQACLRSFNHTGSIVGGDWNATYSTNESVHNIDIHNMAAPPSIFRSHMLCELCLQSGLSDPYRSLYPERRDFTFQPRSRRSNRSRLDFFLVSDCMIDCIKECSISTEIATELFDHKSVQLSFGKSDIKPKAKINSTIFMHPRTLDVVAALTMDTYIQHAAPGMDDWAAEKLQVGNLLSLLRNINDCELDISLNGNSNLRELNLAGLLTQLEEERGRYISTEVLNAIPLSCEDDTFFEVLVGNLKNGLISFQYIQQKISNAKVSHLSNRINRLRDDFLANHQVISELETELNRIVEDNIRKKVTQMKMFEGLSSEKPNPLFLSLAKKKNTGKLSNIKKMMGVSSTRIKRDSSS